MRSTIRTDQPGTIYRQQHRQVLNRDIVYQLVVSSLQESGVNRHYRLVTFTCKSGGEGQCMLLGNTYIKITLWKFFCKFNHAGTLAHGGGNAN